MKASVVLEKAIQVLDTQGWIQQSWIAPNGSVCAVGALGLGAYGTTRQALMGDEGSINAWEHAYRLVTRVIHEQYGRVTPVSAWNDEEDRTKEEVIAVFEKAYIRALEQDI